MDVHRMTALYLLSRASILFGLAVAVYLAIRVALKLWPAAVLAIEHMEAVKHNRVDRYYLLGGMDADEMADFERHMERCEFCREDAAEMQTHIGRGVV